jgi:hypothetical protein
MRPVLQTTVDPTEAGRQLGQTHVDLCAVEFRKRVVSWRPGNEFERMPSIIRKIVEAFCPLESGFSDATKLHSPEAVLRRGKLSWKADSEFSSVRIKRFAQSESPRHSEDFDLRLFLHVKRREMGPNQ